MVDTAATKQSPHTWGSPLTEDDYRNLEASAIPRWLIDQAGLRRVSDYEGRGIVGRSDNFDKDRGDYSGLIFPYCLPGSNVARDYRLRRFRPDQQKKFNGSVRPKGKYMQRPGPWKMLYFPPGVTAERLANPALKLIVTEGEKKALALTALAWQQLSDAAEEPEWIAIAVPGVNNWRYRNKQDGPNGERLDVSEPVDDLYRVQWAKREVVILFDVAPNEQVKAARNSIARELREVGAHVLFADIPAELAAPDINGIDDIIARFGADMALEIIAAAHDPKQKKNTTAPTEDLLSEEKLAQQFEARYQGRLYFDHDRAQWVIWSPECGRWQRNRTRLAYHFARNICREFNRKDAKEFARARTYGGVEQICQNSSTFAVTHEHWDRDPWLLGTPAGTIDLHTGVLREASPNHFITKQTAVSPDFNAKMPVFRQFLKEVTQGDVELERYIQRIAGYSLVGSTKEQKLFLIFGPGGNGKSVLINTLVFIAGDYAQNAAMEAFVERRGERHTTDIAALAGARLVTASETQKGRSWDEALIGRLTGGDPITCRFMRRDNFTYVPQFTLIVVGNHAPDLSSVNQANRRRFHIIPFYFQPSKPDDSLPERLQKEWPAILAWMIQGAADWDQYGLGELPQVVKAETEEYFDEQNHIQAWIDECCEVGPNYSDTSEHLFQSFEAWCKQNGENAGRKTGLIRTLKRQHDCKKDRSARVRGLTGIAVKVVYKPDPRTGEKEEE